MSPLCTFVVSAALAHALAQAPPQPKVMPGPGEPNWVDVLKSRYDLDMIKDLANPVTTTALEVAGRFKKAGAGPVKYSPLIALGMETVTRGGWYVKPEGKDDITKSELWSYKYRNVAADLMNEKNLPPPLLEGSKLEFDPGEESFGVWISNDNFDDNGVFSEPRLVKSRNKRLAAQPYKAMIYPYKDKATGKIKPHAYIIGWEYSTNDDFQDSVCLIENVDLIEPGK